MAKSQCSLCDDLEGYVFVKFNVGKKGKIINVEVLKGITEEIDSIAKKTIENAPPWGKRKISHPPFVLPVEFSKQAVNESFKEDNIASDTTKMNIITVVKSVDKATKKIEIESVINFHPKTGDETLDQKLVDLAREHRKALNTILKEGKFFVNLDDLAHLEKLTKSANSFFRKDVKQMLE